MRLVIALGGNALGAGKYKQQLKTIQKTADLIANLVKQGHTVIVTHGNGPQVGNILLQQNSNGTNAMPLDVCGAMSQGQIGYFLQQSLQSSFSKLKIKKEVVTIITRALVGSKDLAFKNPTKPIGPYYKTKKKGCIHVLGKGWRKVVPSPKPKRILELAEIKELMLEKRIVICCGGGGVPVVKKGNRFLGVEAVIDKDRCAALLARDLNADFLLILTDVDGVYENYGLRQEKKIRTILAKDAKTLLKDLPAGSMRPKLEACIEFVSKTGKKAAIGSLIKGEQALKGKAGTFIM